MDGPLIDITAPAGGCGKGHLWQTAARWVMGGGSLLIIIIIMVIA